MKKRFLEENRAQLALLQALNNSNATGKYFDMRKFRCVTVLMVVLAMAATKTAKIEFVQDKDGDGGDVKAISGAEKTVTANTSVIAATVDLTSVANTDVVTVNSIDFTKAAATDVTAREFADAAGLVSCINNATYGVTGVTASGSGPVTVTADDGYTVTLAKTENAGTITLATTQAIAAVDITIEDLDTDNGFYFVAPKITTTANATAVAAVVIQSEARNEPVSQATPKTIL